MIHPDMRKFSTQKRLWKSDRRFLKKHDDRNDRNKQKPPPVISTCWELYIRSRFATEPIIVASNYISNNNQSTIINY